MCDHRHNNIIIDQHEGTYICTDCAHVVDTYFENTYMTTDKEEVNVHNEKLSKKQTKTNTNINTIKEICEKLFVDKYIVSFALNLYNTIKNLEHITQFNDDEIICFVIFEALIRNNNGLFIHNITYYFPNITNDYFIYKIYEILENKNILNVNVNNIFSYINTLCNQFNLNYKEKQFFRTICNKIPKHILIDIQPKVILSYLIFHYFKKYKRNCKISLKHICKTCNISPSTIFRTIKNRNEIKEIISLL